MQYIVLVLTIISILIVTKFLSWPLKKIFKLLLNIFFGLLCILVVNTFGVKIGLHIPFNSITAIVSGVLGLPGVLCLIILNYIF
ncbi:MAG: pro-sigmaK processing inhibitor BofA family protein [Clostridia bacterium]